jgi:hypothetical protein
MYSPTIEEGQSCCAKIPKLGIAFEDIFKINCCRLRSVHIHSFAVFADVRGKCQRCRRKRARKVDPAREREREERALSRLQILKAKDSLAVTLLAR